MTFKKFEDILAWQKAKSLVITIYKVFYSNKDFGFKDQIQRAAVSIMNNIAEGYERRTNSEFRQFLFISKGSCGEVRSMLHLAEELGYMDCKTKQQLATESEIISKMLSNLIKTL